MSAIEAIRSELEKLQGYTPLEDGGRVVTHCMYPTNTLVEIAVRGQGDTFVASDDGGAVREASSVGLEVGRVRSAFSALVRQQGLLVQDSVIYSPRVPLEGIGAAIVLVANASKEAADWCFEHFKYGRTRKFKDVVAELIGQEFGDAAQKEFEVVGFSNKTHRFEFAIPTSTGHALIDSVTPDSASINSRIVSNLDVQRLSSDKLSQYVIFDDTAKWAPSELELLKMAASIVPYSSAPKFLRSIRR